MVYVVLETSLHTGITQKSDWSYYQNPITSVTEYTDAESGWNKNKGLVAPKIDVVDENQTMKKGNAVLGGEEGKKRERMGISEAAEKISD